MATQFALSGRLLVAARIGRRPRRRIHYAAISGDIATMVMLQALNAARPELEQPLPALPH